MCGVHNRYLTSIRLAERRVLVGRFFRIADEEREPHNENYVVYLTDQERG